MRRTPSISPPNQALNQNNFLINQWFKTYFNYENFSFRILPLIRCCYPNFCSENSESDPIRGFPGTHLETTLLLLPSAARASQRRRASSGVARAPPRTLQRRPRVAARPRGRPGRRARLQRRLRGRPGLPPPLLASRRE